MHLVQNSHLVSQLQHNKLCSYFEACNVSFPSIAIVTLFITSWIFQLLASCTICWIIIWKGRQKSFRSTKVKHTSHDKFYMHFTYYLAFTNILFFSSHWFRILSVMQTQTSINIIMARDEDLAELQSYNLCLSECINKWKDYDHCTIEVWHETCYNSL